MAAARRGVRKKKPKSIVPRTVLNYLKSELCDEGIIELNTFLTTVEPEKVVKAVLGVLAAHVQRAKAQQARELKEELDSMSRNYQERIEQLSGKKLKIELV